MYSTLPVPHTDLCAASFLLFINILFLNHHRWQNTTWSVAWRQDFGRIHHEPPKRRVQKRTSGEWWRPSSEDALYPWRNFEGKRLWEGGQKEQGLCSKTFVLYPCLNVCCTLYLFNRESILKKKNRKLYFEALIFLCYFVTFVANFSSICFSSLKNV